MADVVTAADGQIFDRILRAEDQPASTSTNPRLDNEELVPLNEALRTAQRARDAATAARVAAQIEKILCREVERRYGLIQTGLAVCRRFPTSLAANYVQDQDRARHDRNLAYVVDPNALLASGLSGNAATAEFLSREFNAEHVEQLRVRSVSAARAAARLAGDILVGTVNDRREYKSGRKTIITYEVETNHERLSVRRGDKLTPLDNEALRFVVLDVSLGVSGDTTVSLELRAGKRSSSQPDVGDAVEMAEPLRSMERIVRTMGLAHSRLRSKPALEQVTGRLPVARDYLSRVRGLRRNG